MKRALLSTLQATAIRRKPGYLEACLKAGRASADGGWVVFSDQDHAKLRQDFAKERRSLGEPCVPCRSKTKG
jgi:hypothetical protein